ncbi:hypothetical protein ACWA2C_16745 [Priestia megaterium]
MELIQEYLELKQPRFSVSKPTVSHAHIQPRHGVITINGIEKEIDCRTMVIDTKVERQPIYNGISNAAVAYGFSGRYIELTLEIILGEDEELERLLLGASEHRFSNHVNLKIQQDNHISRIDGRIVDLKFNALETDVHALITGTVRIITDRIH